MSAAFKYYAFISYKRLDSKWADWLYRSLQNYRLPGKLCKEHRELPKRLNPVFIDKEDLVPGNLSDTLKEHIAMSKYFLAVCSRNCRRDPEYIDLELQYFLETHGNDYTKVIPFIVDDAPRPEQECFSPLMQQLCRDHQLIGVNVTERGRRRAFLKVVAYMHGLQVSEIESGDDRRRRKNRLIAAVSAAAVVLAAALGVNYWWQNLALHTDYYTSCIWENNVARGVGAIKKADLSAYSRYYRFESRQGRVYTVTYLNDLGATVPLDEETTVLNLGASRVEFTYTGAQEPTLYQARYFGADDIPLVCYQFNADGTHVTLLRDETSGMPTYMAADLSADLPIGGKRTHVSRYIQDLDENGRVIRRRYAYGDEYTEMTDGAGTYGYELFYGDGGALTGVIYFSDVGATAVGESNGISATIYGYDTGGRMTSVGYFDADGNPVAGADGWAEKEYTWHANNNYAAIAYRGPDGAPALYHGYASLTQEYDGVSIAKTSFWDENGAPALFWEGYASVTYRTNEIGQISSYRYWDATGAPTADWVSGTCGYDIYWNSDREHYLVYVDENDQPKETLEGYAYQYVTTDNFGNIVRIEYRDVNNELCRGRFAVYTCIYDENHRNITARQFLDADGTPVVHPDLGYASLVSTYDSRDFVTSLTYCDAQDRPCMGPDGYARMEASNVQEGNYTVETVLYFDDAGDPVFYEPIGAHGYEYTRDESGATIGVVYLGADGRPCDNEREGYAMVLFQYDTAGNVIETYYLNATGDYTMVDGYARLSASYDENGNLTEYILWVIENGQLVPAP